MKTLRFELTMPNNGSWNNVDTGNKGRHYAFRKVSNDLANKLKDKSFFYDFGDGWVANVIVTINRTCKSNGFRGYNWMINEIIEYGEIKNVHERRLKNKLEKEFRGMLKSFFDKNGLTKCDSKFMCSGMPEAFNFEYNQSVYESEKNQLVRGLTQ